MPAVTHTLNRFISEYGRAVLLALLVHVVILSLLLTKPFSKTVQLPLAEPITSFLYQPPPVAPAAMPQAPDILPPESESITAQDLPETSPALATAGAPSTQYPPIAAEPHAATDADNEQDTLANKPVTQAVTGNSLAQRALNRVAKPEAAAIEQAATASYQQFLQQQQQPRLTVDKKHWPLSQDPKAQVVAQLDDGRQIIRMKEGCRIGDPTKDGFEALMAAKLVPCGDEVSTSELLKQALDKHIRR